MFDLFQSSTTPAASSRLFPISDTLSLSLAPTLSHKRSGSLCAKLVRSAQTDTSLHNKPCGITPIHQLSIILMVSKANIFLRAR